MPAIGHNTTLQALQALQGAGVTSVIVQRGDATGDQSHVIPVLTLNPNHGVLVIDAVTTNTLKVTGPTAPKGRRMADSYVDDFQIPAGQVAYMNRSPLRMNAALNVPMIAGIQPVGLTDTTDLSTTLVLQGKPNRTIIKAQFRGAKIGLNALPGLPGATQQDIALDTFRVNQGIGLTNHVVVIWGRKSGGNGGLYPYLDSSAMGMSQIAAECHQLGYTVLVAGDITQAKMAKAGFANAIWLGDFWSRWQPIPNSRALQIRFFYVLSKQLKVQNPIRRLVHVGMRSGGLDMYTFSGQRVIYIMAPVKHLGGVNDFRMEPIVNRFQGAAAAAPQGHIGTYSFERYLAERIPKRYTKKNRPGGSGFLPADVLGLGQQITATLNRV